MYTHTHTYIHTYIQQLHEEMQALKRRSHTPISNTRTSTGTPFVRPHTENSARFFGANPPLNLAGDAGAEAGSRNGAPLKCVFVA